MLRAWNLLPTVRPTFEEMTNYFQELLDGFHIDDDDEIERNYS
jgi:hypothetical protein